MLLNISSAEKNILQVWIFASWPDLFVSGPLELETGHAEGRKLSEHSVVLPNHETSTEKNKTKKKKCLSLSTDTVFAVANHVRVSKILQHGQGTAVQCKLAVAGFLSKADFCMSALITQAIPLAAKAIKCNTFDWLHSFGQTCTQLYT